MRYIPIKGVTDGMVCGKSLYDVNSQLLLSKGTILHQGYIDRIEELGYQGIYIDDGISSDIVVKDVISDELRVSAVKVIKDICIYSKEGKVNTDTLDKKVLQTRFLIANIIDQILENEDAMVNLIDLKFFDDYTFFHSVNVGVLSVIIGMEYGLDRNALINLGLAAILHDIGKIFVDKKILNKPGKLTPEEMQIMKEHPYKGYALLKESYEVPTNVYVAILQHHERYDGGGYPNGKKGDDILLSGRIISMTDVYDALISKRPYREALLPSEAMEYIMAGGGSLFDINLTKIFARKVAPFPIGTYVRLSNGYSGIVFNNFEDACMRPMVKLIVDPTGKQLAKPFFADLKGNKDLRSVTIVGVNELNIG